MYNLVGMYKQEVTVLLGALGFAVLTAIALMRPLPDAAAEESRRRSALLEATDLAGGSMKDALSALFGLGDDDRLRRTDLRSLHHVIYSKVGERRWENEVKPAFFRGITARTIWATGKLIPDWDDLVGWVREHPEEANAILIRASGIPNEKP